MAGPLTAKAAILPLVLLVAFLLWRGVLPAWSGLDTDFPNYYTSGRIVLDGGAVERLYDDRWFQEQIGGYGMTQAGKFSPFPPPTALLFVPLASLDPATALRVMTIANLLMLIGAWLALSRLTRAPLWQTALLILLSGTGLANCFRFGQLYIALSLSLLAAFFLYRTGRPLLAGAVLGWMIPIKYFPLILLPYFVWRREWRVVASALGTALLITALSIASLGWEIHRQFLVAVAGGHLQGVLSMQDPFSPTFQSFDTLFRRLFVADAAWNPAPPFVLPILPPLLKGTAAALAIAVIVRCARRFHSNVPAADDSALVALLMIAGLLLAPATATYHMLLLWLPAGLLLSGPLLPGISAPRFWLFLGAYSCVGFIPYSVFAPFDGRALLTILAYPRLWLLLLLFVVAVIGVRNSAIGARSGGSET